MKSLEFSLKRLQRDSIDTFLLNGLPKDGIISDKVLSRMESSVYHGTLKHWGISPSKYSEVELRFIICKNIIQWCRIFILLS